MNVIDIAKAISPVCKTEIIGIRPGEKLHEQMIGPEDAEFTYEYDDYFKIIPFSRAKAFDCNYTAGGTKVPEDFCYTSINNREIMTHKQLRHWVEKTYKVKL